MSLDLSSYSSTTEGVVYLRKRKPKAFMDDNKEAKTPPQDDSDEEIQLTTDREEQSVPLLLNKENTTKATTSQAQQGSAKHILIIHEEDGDSGISETASEELSVLTEPPRGSVSEEHEGFISVIVQIFIPYIIAGFGMMSAGFLLDYVQVNTV